VNYILLNPVFDEEAQMEPLCQDFLPLVQWSGKPRNISTYIVFPDKPSSKAADFGRYHFRHQFKKYVLALYVRF
jgi:hypothetical protein